MGVTGAGKSTVGVLIARCLRAEFVDGDDLHGSRARHKLMLGLPLDDDDRAPWLDGVATVLRERAARGQSVVVACSALRRSHRTRLRAAAPDLCFVYLEIDPATAATRLRSRVGHFAGPAILASQIRILEPPRHAIRVAARGTPAEIASNAVALLHAGR